MHRMPKYVVSSRDPGDRWPNCHRVEVDLDDAVADLKSEISGDIVVFGSGILVRGPAAIDAVDVNRLLHFPVVLGSGKRMLDEHSRLAHFR